MSPSDTLRVHHLEFATAAICDERLAHAVAARLADALAQRGSALLVVSGGRTPIGFFHCLAAQPLAWENVTVTLADERWVEPSHPDSNEKLVREHLLTQHAARARFLPLKNAAPTAHAGEAECERALAGLGRFDAVVLGVGNDGHTASLFPEAPELPRGLDPESHRACVAITPAHAPHQRMSLTLPRLLDTEFLVVHIVGAEKSALLARAQTPGSALPIASVLRQTQTSVTIYSARDY